MYKKHFEITANKKIYAFGEQCNKVDYSDNKYLLCFNENNDGKQLLGMLPHCSVKEVLLIRNSEES